MIKIRIIKLPPEAEKLAKKFEDVLATMVARTVKTMVGVDNDLKNLEITVSEGLIKGVKGDPPMKITKKYLQRIIKEEVGKLLNEWVVKPTEFRTPWSRSTRSRLTITSPSLGPSGHPKEKGIVAKGTIAATIADIAVHDGEPYVAAIGYGMSPKEAAVDAIDKYMKSSYATPSPEFSKRNPHVTAADIRSLLEASIYKLIHKPKPTK